MSQEVDGYKEVTNVVAVPYLQGNLLTLVAFGGYKHI